MILHVPGFSVFIADGIEFLLHGLTERQFRRHDLFDIVQIAAQQTENDFGLDNGLECHIGIGAVYLQQSQQVFQVFLDCIGFRFRERLAERFCVGFCLMLLIDCHFVQWHGQGNLVDIAVVQCIRDFGVQVGEITVKERSVLLIRQGWCCLVLFISGFSHGNFEAEFLNVFLEGFFAGFRFTGTEVKIDLVAEMPEFNYGSDSAGDFFIA